MTIYSFRLLFASCGDYYSKRSISKKERMRAMENLEKQLGEDRLEIAQSFMVVKILVVLFGNVMLLLYFYFVI